MMVLMLTAIVAVFLLQVLACTAVQPNATDVTACYGSRNQHHHCGQLIIALFLLNNFFCCRCCDRTKVAATAVAAATFGACYANATAATAITGSLCPCHHHCLIVAF